MYSIVSYDPDIEARTDAIAKLQTLPKRMAKVGAIRAKGRMPLVRLQLRLLTQEGYLNS